MGSLLADIVFVLPRAFTVPKLSENYERIPEGTKRCGTCSEILPLGEFPWLVKDKRRYYCCVKCRKHKLKEAYRRRISQKVEKQGK